MYVVRQFTAQSGIFGSQAIPEIVTKTLNYEVWIEQRKNRLWSWLLMADRSRKIYLFNCDNTYNLKIIVELEFLLEVEEKLR